MATGEGPPGTTTIVVVEDNPDDAHLVRIEFEDAGVTNDLVVLDDGDAALRFLRRHEPFADAPTPGLVLLDLHLPRVDGHEVLEAIERDESLRAPPVVMMSVPTELAWVEEHYGHLVAGVLAKPISVEALTRTVATIDRLGPGFLRRG
jgi:CheY-like chemotaxis protein